jgi:hypothetical protein
MKYALILLTPGEQKGYALFTENNNNTSRALLQDLQTAALTYGIKTKDKNIYIAEIIKEPQDKTNITTGEIIGIKTIQLISQIIEPIEESQDLTHTGIAYNLKFFNNFESTLVAEIRSNSLSSITLQNEKYIPIEEHLSKGESQWLTEAHKAENTYMFTEIAKKLEFTSEIIEGTNTLIFEISENSEIQAFYSNSKLVNWKTSNIMKKWFYRNEESMIKLITTLEKHYDVIKIITPKKTFYKKSETNNTLTLLDIKIGKNFYHITESTDITCRLNTHESNNHITMDEIENHKTLPAEVINNIIHSIIREAIGQGETLKTLLEYTTIEKIKEALQEKTYSAIPRDIKNYEGAISNHIIYEEIAKNITLKYLDFFFEYTELYTSDRKTDQNWDHIILFLVAFCPDYTLWEVDLEKINLSNLRKLLRFQNGFKTALIERSDEYQYQIQIAFTFNSILKSEHNLFNTWFFETVYIGDQRIIHLEDKEFRIQEGKIQEVISKKIHGYIIKNNLVITSTNWGWTAYALNLNVYKLEKPVNNWNHAFFTYMNSEFINDLKTKELIEFIDDLEEEETNCHTIKFKPVFVALKTLLENKQTIAKLSNEEINPKKELILEIIKFFTLRYTKNADEEKNALDEILSNLEIHTSPELKHLIQNRITILNVMKSSTTH